MQASAKSKPSAAVPSKMQRQATAPRFAGTTEGDAATLATNYRKKRTREIAFLVNGLTGWLYSRIKANTDWVSKLNQPSTAFSTFDVKKDDQVALLIRCLLAYAVNGGLAATPSGSTAAPSGVLQDGKVPALIAVDEDKLETRYVAYETTLNECFGKSGDFPLHTEAQPFGDQTEKNVNNSLVAKWIKNGKMVSGGPTSIVVVGSGVSDYPLVLPMALSAGGASAQPTAAKVAGASTSAKATAPKAAVAATKPKAAGSDAPSAARTAGLVGDETTETLQYVPTIPRVSEVRRSTTPCMYERKVQKGDGYWAWKCERTNQAGVKKCKLVRVEDSKTTLVPIQCLQEYVNVLKGFEVQKTTKELADGKTSVTQTITPEVQVYGSVTPQGPAGPGIPYRDLTPSSTQYPPQAPADIKPSLLAFPIGAPGLQRSYPVSRLDVGGGGRTEAAAAAQRSAGGRASSRSAARAAAPAARTGAAASGGAMNLPSRSEVRGKQFYLTNQDIEDITTGVPADMMPRPANWANLAPPEDPNEIAFYTYDDSYGTASTRRLQNGFPFSFKYLPFAYMTNQAYLEWLVSLDYKMRAEFPEDHTHVYDPLLDTIATVETAILVTLGRLEARGQYFNRRDLFEGKEPFRDVMHRYLRVYAFSPPQNTWYSPLSGRYIALPDAPMPAPAGERRALALLQGLNDEVGSLALSGAKISAGAESYHIPAKFRTFGGARTINLGGGGLTDPVVSDPTRAALPTPRFAKEDMSVVGIAEDELLSTLARLQYMHGFAVNMNDDALKAFTVALLSAEQRRFLSREMIRYIEMFSLDGEQGALHRLPALRMREAAERGLVLPQSAMSQYGAEWTSAANAALPGQTRASRAPSLISTVVGSPRVIGARP